MSALQVRNIPDEVQRVLKQRAARAGQSLSEYVLGELRVLAERPTIEELTERIALRGHVDVAMPAADILFEERLRRP
jgi:plasmid stability protein